MLVKGGTGAIVYPVYIIIYFGKYELHDKKYYWNDIMWNKNIGVID